MKGFYSIWTKPFFQQKNVKEFYLQDYELLTLLLSVGAFQKYNGPAHMYADRIAYCYLEKHHLCSLFQDGVSLLEVPNEIRPNVFWAAGKLYALKQLKEPSIMVDLDLVIWKDLEPFLFSRDIAVIHREEITQAIYPDASFFSMNQEYHFDSRWDWKEPAANTALLYIKDMNFRNYYVNEALRFIQNCNEKDENLCHMVFAEQRMLALCAKLKKIEISSFFNQMWELDGQDVFTHVWGHKNVLKFNYDERRKYCIRCIRRIKKDFEEVYQFVKKQDEFLEYCKVIEEE